MPSPHRLKAMLRVDRFTRAILSTFTYLSTKWLRGSTSFSILTFLFKWNLEKSFMRTWSKRRVSVFSPSKLVPPTTSFTKTAGKETFSVFPGQRKATGWTSQWIHMIVCVLHKPRSQQYSGTGHERAEQIRHSARILGKPDWLHGIYSDFILKRQCAIPR